MYFVYRHIRLDKKQVFYVGIGTKTSDELIKKLGDTKRARYRRAFERTSRNNHWKSIVALVDYKVEIFYETDSKEEVINKEIYFIELYKNTVCNQTKGGLGIDSYNHTEETKRKISNSTKGRKLSPKHRENVNKAKLKAVVMLDSSKTEVRCFNSITEAAEFIGNKESAKKNICACLNGKRPTAYKYKWKYKESKEVADKEPLR